MRRVIRTGRVRMLLGAVLLGLLSTGNGVKADAASSQFSWGDVMHPKKSALEYAVCRPNSPLAKQFSDRLSALSATATKTTGISVEGQKRQFEIGIAMALCHGGFRVAGTLYSRMSEHDQNARQKALDDAVAHESKDSTTYVLPDHPDITGTITPVSTVAENGKECTVFKDTVAEGAQNDSALNKFCRTPPSNEWKPQLTV